ncbi:hypothetical protein D3C87_1149720 [compost metagenome]
MRAAPSAPFCAESASVCQSQALREPSSTGTRASAGTACNAAPTGLLLEQAAIWEAGTLGTAPMSAYQALALPRPTATVLTHGMAASSRWMAMNSSSDFAWLQRSQLRKVRKFWSLMSRIA